jgi:retron-type reverse transcriptase
MNLATPERIRSLQRKLYCKAKADPAFRFYTLYDKICRRDILEHAYALARANAGAPGVDGVTFAAIEALGLEEWLARLREELATKTYRPAPVRRAMIPKPGGGERPLGIPTIRDRVAQTAAKLVLEPIFEAEERDGEGTRRMTGGKNSPCGTPQGGVVSPLLANVYMNRFLKHWRLTGRGEAFQAHVIAYADDFVILSRGHAAEALTWTKAVMTKLGLTLNEAKTSLKDAREERFEFLGYSLGPHRRWKNGQRYLGASPSKKSVQRVKTKVGELLVPGNKGPWLQVRNQLNSLLSGWSAYFSYGTRVTAYRAVDAHVYDRVRRFLRKRHNMRGQGTRRFSFAVVYGELGVLRLASACKGRSSCALR